MRLLNILMAAAMLLGVVGCEKVEFEQKVYPELESLDGTLWYSYDEEKQIFYDIVYQTNTGAMLGYSDQERTDEVVNRPFSYTFTPAANGVNAIVRIDFKDGVQYGGALFTKGNIQVNYQDVYFIQLYEVDDAGYPLKDSEGNFKSIIQMWYEGPEATK